MHSRLLHVAGHQVGVLGDNETAPGAAVVFLHGIMTTIDLWPVVTPPAVRDRRRWYAVSLPGHFPGGFPDGLRRDDITIDSFTDVIAGAIEQLEGTNPVVLVGWSTGGFAALSLAARFPRRILGVMSISGFARGAWGSWLGWLQRLSRMPTHSRGAAQLAGRLITASERSFEWFTLRGAANRRQVRRREDWPEVLRLLRAAARRSDAAGIAGLMARLREFDISDRLAGITAPVEIVAGLRDPFVTGRETRHLLSLLPGAKATLAPDAGHLFFAEYPDVWRRLLPDWLDRLPTA